MKIGEDNSIINDSFTSTLDSAFNDGFNEGHFVGYSFGYEDGIAVERDRILSIVSRCIAHNVYNVSEGIALLNYIKEEIQNGNQV